MKEMLAVIAVILIIVAYTPYIINTVKGKTKPHVYSWFISSLVTFIAFGVQISGGGGWTCLPTFVAAVAAVIIFLFSLGPDRTPITKSDTIFFILALIATLLWVVEDQLIMSVILVSLIDTLAFMPTFRKSWHRPYEETASAYAVNGLRFTISGMAVQNYSIVTVLYPLSQAIVDLFFFTFLILRRQAIQKKTKIKAANINFIGAQ